MNSLRLEAAKIGVLPTSRGRGRGGWRGRGGRGAPRGFTPRGRGFGGRGRGFTLSPGAANLDRRPSRILVSGYELEEKEELVQHFAKFGEILEQVEDEVRGGTPGPFYYEAKASLWFTPVCSLVSQLVSPT